MAVIKGITQVLFYSFVLFISKEVSCEDSSIIDAVLGSLNSNLNRVFDYKRGHLLDVQYRGDVIETSTEIEATCNGWFPDIPCNDQMFTCHAYLGQSSMQPNFYEVLSDVRCTPKVIEPATEEVDNVRNVPLSFAEQRDQTGKLDLSHEALPPEQEKADFIAVRRNSFPCPGCPFDLDKNAEGIDELLNAALKHIESERAQRHKITNVRRIQEQVVAGIKYILEVDVAQTTCGKKSDLLSQCPLDTSVEPFICEVSFFEQPWISRTKHIFKNNCTVSQEFELPESRNEISNEIQKDDTANANIHLDHKRLADIESQIISDADLFEGPKEVKLKIQNTRHSVQESSPSFQQIEGLNVEPLMAKNDRPELRTLYVSMPVVDEAEPIVVSYVPQNDQNMPEQTELHDFLIKDLIPREEMFKRDAATKKDSSEEDSKSKKSSDESISNSSSSSEEQTQVAREQTTITTGDAVVVKREAKSNSDSSEEISKNKSVDNSQEDEKKRNKRAAHLMGNNRSKRSVGQLEKVPSEEKVIVRDLADFAANILDNKDDDNHKRVILQILGAKKLKLDGIYYQIILRLGISHCQEHEHHESCREKLFTNLTKICKVQVHVDDDYSNPKLVKSQCQNIKKDENDRNRTNYSRYRRQLVGGISPLDKTHPKVKKFLSKTLDYVDSMSEHPNKHKAVEILSATSQVVAGSRYVIRFKIGVTKCPKTQDISAENCELLESAEPEECEVSIWDRPWLKDTRYNIDCLGKVYNFGGAHKLRRKRFNSNITKGLVKHPQNAIIDALNELSNKDPTYKYIISTYTYTYSLEERFFNFTADVDICHKYAHTCKKNVPFIFIFSSEDMLINGLNLEIIRDANVPPYKYRSYKFLEFEPALQQQAFDRFVAMFLKNYKNEKEYRYRLKVYKDNLKKIERLNRNEQGTGIYGITEFADLTEEEFSRRHGYRPELRNENDLPFLKAATPEIDLPIEFDWRDKGAVTAVKNQGFCGSCWAFSVTGNVEGQYAIKHGKLLEFSEQELVDCDKVDEGCNGGLMDNAYRVIEKLGGLESESDYPYEGADDTCHFNVSKVEVQLTGAVNISHNETDMAKWLVANGPISIAINANAMQFYVGGVSHPFKVLCNPNNLDHGVLIVGYGVHTYKLFNKTMPYWIVKNSWGKSWGEQGYYRVYRGDGTCGLNQTPSSALVA